MTPASQRRRRLCGPILFCLFSAILAGYSPGQAGEPAGPKYVLIFLADGGSATQLEVARTYNRLLHDEQTVITDRIMKKGVFGMLTTHSADRLVTDSAAAATAMAAGCKARNGSVGICHDGSAPMTAMEAAKADGRRIGLVTNSFIYDASPAAFVAHLPSRRDYGAILARYLEVQPDLLLGGGRDLFLPRSQRESRRKDRADLIARFQQAGYAYASSRKELSTVQGEKVLGLFALNEMTFELDRGESPEPGLDEMTAAALRILSGRGFRGFVLFVESEHTDSAAHLTDPAALVHAWREFDRAVGEGYRFYRKRPSETLLLVTSDHDTGGFGFTASASPRELQKLKSIGVSFRRASEILGERPSARAIDRLISDHFKGFALGADLKRAIIERRRVAPHLPRDPTAAALGVMVAAEIQAVWATSGHTNQPVFVAAVGAGAERFRGYQDNTDFGRHLLALLRRTKRH